MFLLLPSLQSLRHKPEYISGMFMTASTASAVCVLRLLIRVIMNVRVLGLCYCVRYHLRTALQRFLSQPRGGQRAEAAPPPSVRSSRYSTSKQRACCTPPTRQWRRGDQPCAEAVCGRRCRRSAGGGGAWAVHHLLPRARLTGPRRVRVP
jgi:hypothetical protein